MRFVGLPLEHFQGGRASKTAKIGEYELELEISGLKKPRKISIIQTLAGGALLLKIDDATHQVTLLKVTTNDVEFILDNRYYRAKVVQSDSHEVRLLIHTTLVLIRKNPSIREFLRRSLAKDQRAEGGDKDVKSQIPGRVVSIVAQAGSAVKRGDPIIVLESMKMQVAVKTHRDGNLKQIKVSQGDTVSRYDVVAVLD
jgi:biotin carboxyl carrier protein